jgi:hypothetical protein
MFARCSPRSALRIASASPANARLWLLRRGRPRNTTKYVCTLARGKREHRHICARERGRGTCSAGGIYAAPCAGIGHATHAPSLVCRMTRGCGRGFCDVEARACVFRGTNAWRSSAQVRALRGLPASRLGTRVLPRMCVCVCLCLREAAAEVFGRTGQVIAAHAGMRRHDTPAACDASPPSEFVRYAPYCLRPTHFRCVVSGRPDGRTTATDRQTNRQTDM